MKDKRFLHWIVLMALLLPAVGGVSHGGNEIPQLTLLLNDGSRIIGRSSLTTIPVSSATTGTEAIPLAIVQEIKFAADHTNVILRVAHGGQIKAALDLSALQLNTSFGFVTVPIGLINVCHVHLLTSSNTPNDALQFDGAQNYVSVPAFNNTTTDKTVEFWAKSNDTGGGFYAGAWSDPYEWYLINNTDINQFYLGTATGYVYITPSPAEASDGVWHHYALVEQGGTITIYIDGTSRASGTASLSQTGGFTIGTVGSVTGNTGSSLTSYHGTIDEFRISNIATHTGQFDPCDPANFVNSEHTVAVWHFYEGNGITVADSSGHGHTGTLQGAPLPAWVGGFDCLGLVPAKKPKK